MEKVIHLTGETFQKEVLDFEGVALVDFWAPWCGPCQMLGPVIEELSHELTDVKVVKVNVDEAQELSGKYGVSGIPTVMLFKDGQAVETIVGFRQKQDYLAAISKA